MSVDKQLIESVREKFLKEYEANESLYYKQDVDKLRTNDWSVERFALVHKTEDATLKALIKAMKWRKEYGLLDRTDQDFPQEVYQIIQAVPYGTKDKEGRPFLITASKYFHKSELTATVKQFIVHQIEKLDSQTSHHGGYGLVNDSSGAGLSNVEMDFAFFMITTMQDIYPRGPKYMLVIDMPWILNATWKILRNFMSEELRNVVNLASRDQLFSDFVDKENIPPLLKGTCDRPLVNIPDGVVSMEKLTKLGFNEKQIDKIRSTFKEALKDNPV